MSKKIIYLNSLREFLVGDRHVDRIVPPSGYTAKLTIISACVMGLLAVFALALLFTTSRLGEELENRSTVIIYGLEEKISAQADAVLKILKTTPGIKSARLMTKDEQLKLLSPWFGVEVTLGNFPIPKLIEIIEEKTDPDVTGLRMHLSAQVIGAVFDDPSRWQKPLVPAASSLRFFGGFSLLLILFLTGMMISLAAQASLSANQQVISVLRLIGARDSYIIKAFVRRFTFRAFFGALVGTVIGMVCILLLASPTQKGAFLIGLNFSGWQWVWPTAIPFFAGISAFFATKFAAKYTLKGTV